MILAVFYPLLGLALKVYDKHFWDPLLFRVLISGLALSFLFFTYRNTAFRRKLNLVNIITYATISGHTLLLVGFNRLSPIYVVSTMIALGLGNIILKSTRQFIVFTALFFLLAILQTFFIENPQSDKVIFYGALLIISFTGFMSLKFKTPGNGELASLIANNFNEGILVVSMDDITKYANTRIAEILGCKVSDLVGSDIKEFLASKEDKNKVLGKTTTRTNGISDKYELNFRHTSGAIIHTEVSGNPTYDHNGKATGSVSIITDITERREAEKKLERLSLVASKTENYVIITDEKDQIIWTNEGFERITGYSLAEISGKQPKSFLHGKSTDPSTVERINEKKIITKPFYDEIQNYTKKGDQIWVSLNVTPLVDEQGQITGYITIGNDITARKDAEENLKQKAFRLSIIRQIDQTIIASESLSTLANNTIDNVIKLLPTCHEVSLSLLKGNDGEYDVLASVNDLDAPKYFPDRIQPILEAGYPYLVSDVEKVQNSVILEKKLESEGFKTYVFIPLIYGNTLLGTLNLYWKEVHPKITEDVEMLESVARDVAVSIKQLSLQHALTSKNRELKSKLRELKSTHEELQSFSYIVSHDLKAPLRAISSLADWLIKDYAEQLDDQGKKYLNLLMGRTHRMHNLIDGTLQYSRIGRKNVEKETIGVEEIIDNVLLMLSPPSNIAVKIYQPLPYVVYNAVQLQQVFQNLISNAIKFMDKQEGQVEIGVSEKSGMYEFFVKDNGPGMDEKHHDKIFKIFQTLSPKDNNENTGIGLTIVKKIVELNEGEIWVESAVNKGASFYFSIPKNKAVAQIDEDKIKERTNE
ncbi:PAS domain S-box protein [Fulvivirga sp. M361]|uniref:PAS domain S-box protein n=1 Tax=Fulvivirga sp. M361 TaxID=2594266 RepID=UPI001626798C|nr:PAS domain S-box protein [Fulvivirga sp. M361]